MLRTIWAVIVAFVVTVPLSTAVMIIALLSSSSPWIEPIIRLNANGEMQFERTLNFAMSIAMDFDSATMAILAAE